MTCRHFTEGAVDDRVGGPCESPQVTYQKPVLDTLIFIKIQPIRQLFEHNVLKLTY